VPAHFNFWTTETYNIAVFVLLSEMCSHLQQYTALYNVILKWLYLIRIMQIWYVGFENFPRVASQNILFLEYWSASLLNIVFQISWYPYLHSPNYTGRQSQCYIMGLSLSVVFCNTIETPQAQVEYSSDLCSSVSKWHELIFVCRLSFVCRKFV
jgi:hypothetical protein